MQILTSDVESRRENSAVATQLEMSNVVVVYVLRRGKIVNYVEVNYSIII